MMRIPIKQVKNIKEAVEFVLQNPKILPFSADSQTNPHSVIVKTK